MSLLIACRSRLVRELLVELFRRLPQQIGQISEDVEQLDSIGSEDIVLLYGDGSVEETLAKIVAVRERAAQSTIIFVGRPLEQAHFESLQAAGANAIVSDENSASTVVGMILMLQAGFRFVVGEGPTEPARQTPKLADSMSQSPLPLPRSQPLSPQELRILTRLINGHSNKLIAGELGISEATVKVHLRACYEKIGARNRTQAAMWAATHLATASHRESPRQITPTGTSAERHTGV